MSVTAAMALIRDAIILIALGFIVWWIRTDAVKSIKIADLKAVQSQLADNALRQAQFAQEAIHAQDQHTQDLQTISAAIASHSASPVLLCQSPDPSPMHGVSPTSGAQPAASGKTDPGSGSPPAPVNIRNSVTGFEQEYENALADCRQALASWPH
jgi:hypothetical protein